MSVSKPSIDVLLERLDQNTKLTKEVKYDVQEGFKTLNSRVSKNSESIYELQLQRKYDLENLKNAQEEAKRILEIAAVNAKQVLKDDKPTTGDNKWLLTALISIILALISAGVLTR